MSVSKVPGFITMAGLGGAFYAIGKDIYDEQSLYVKCLNATKGLTEILSSVGKLVANELDVNQLKIYEIEGCDKALKEYHEEHVKMLAAVAIITLCAGVIFYKNRR